MRFDIIDPELSEATTSMVSGSPPKMGVPRLALEILRSPSTGPTPSPENQFGTLSPDPTKMMADISSPRSAFSRHSSRTGLADMLREDLRESSSPSK